MLWKVRVLSITVICITSFVSWSPTRQDRHAHKSSSSTFSSLLYCTLLDLFPFFHLARLLPNDNLISAKMPRSNGETSAWCEDGLLNGKVPEEKFKHEFIKFFQLSTKESAKSKQYFKKDVQEFVSKQHAKMSNKRIFWRPWRPR